MGQKAKLMAEDAQETIKLTEEHREVIEWLASLTQTIHYM